jgi:sigma-B regulation protein RsbU (phosphoserine phosphatase)
VFYTDGISENFNAAGEEFGRHRLRELIAANCRFGAAELLQRIFDEASRWSAGHPASDDRTAVVLRRADEPQSH